MALQNLTDAFLRNIKGDGQQTDYRDAKTSGLVLRVSGTAEKTTKSWGVIYRRKSDGKRRRVTFGSYPEYSLVDARREALNIMSAVARGEDPAKAAKRPNSTKPRTFDELAARYMEIHAVQKRSWREDEKMLNRDLLPALAGEPLTAIHRADVAAIIDAIVARGAPIRANRTFALVRKIFNFAVEKGYMENTPIFRMKPPAKAQSRDRMLSADEIRVFWRRVTAKTRMDWEMRMLLKLCLVTGQRISKVAGTKFSELKFHKAEWHIPEERLKNKLPVHIVPLSPLAFRLFQKAVSRSKSETYVLPSRSTGRPIVNTAPAHAIRDNAMVFGFEQPFTPHDLRRTLASGLGELDVPRLIQDKVLNHKTADNNIGGVYDRYAYLKQKRKALEAWDAHLQSIIFNKRPKPLAVVRTNAMPSKSASPWAAF